MRKTIISGLMMLVITLTFACGSGGGGGDTGTGGSGGQVQPTTATLKLAISGTITTIYGVDVVVNLPAGVTVKSTANPPETDNGVATVSGVAASNSTLMAVYTEAAAPHPGKVRILIGNANGFGTGEFGTINCAIAAGHTPAAADFSVSDFTASDANGAVIAGLTVGFTADIR